jgi:outer membrane protein TolC
VDNALARLGIAQAQRYPSLVFSASANTGGSAISQWLSNPVGSLGAALSVPLVDFRRLEVAQQDAKSELDLAALALRLAVIAAAQDIERAWLQADRANQAWRNAQAQRQLADEQLRRVQAQFDNASVARADVLQAQSERLRADTELEQARSRTWLARLDQMRAVAAD